MSQKVNFAGHQEVKIAYEDSYLIISQSATQKPFKIKASLFFETLSNLLSTTLISTDVPNSLAIGTDGLLTDNMGSYGETFLTSSFTAGVLSIPASVHNLGVGLKHVTVVDSAGDVVNPTIDINIDYLSGDVTITATPFNGQLLITSILI